MGSKRSKNIKLIAKELSLSEDVVENLIAQVWEILGKPVFSEVILKAIKQIQNSKKITAQLVACFIEPQTYGLNQIAEELNVDMKTAYIFYSGVCRSLGMQVEYLTVLETLWQIEDGENIKPRNIASQIDIISPVANELGVDRETANNFIVEFQKLTGKYVINYLKFLEVIQQQIKNEERPTPEIIANFFLDDKIVIRLIGQILNTNDKAAKKFCKQVKQVVDQKKYKVNPRVVLKALRGIENQKEISPQIVASLIEQNSIQTPAKEPNTPKRKDIGSISTISKSMTPFEKESRKIAQTLFAELKIILPTTKTKALKDFSRRCWDEINQERRYQIPSGGRAEIMVFQTLERLIGLKLVRFVQEGIKAPGVFIQFEFGNERAIATVKVNGNGHVEGFHKFVGPDNSFECIIEAVALSYYRDLVTPGKVYNYEPGRGLPKSGPVNKLVNFKKLPRPQSIPIFQKNSSYFQARQTYRLNEWYEVQEYIKHRVVGHTRWVRENFVARSDKRQQAREAGVKLPIGYTWVVEHERSQSSSALRVDSNGNLAEKTLFLPPERASTELTDILS